MVMPSAMKIGKLMKGYRHNMDKELLKALEDAHLAIVNAQEECGKALLEIERLKSQDITERYMKSFDAMMKVIFNEKA